MQDELLEQAEHAVELAKAAGADDVVAGVSWGRSLEYRWREGKAEKVQEDVSRSLGLRLYVNGRYSAHSTNDLQPDRLKAFVQEAVALTRLLEPDPHRFITPAQLYEGRLDVDLDQVDGSLVGLTPEQRIAWCQTLENEARAHDDVISATSAVMDSHGMSARVSSNGFSGCRESTSVWYGAEVTISDGPTKRPEAYRYVGGTHLEDLPAPETAGAEALRRVLARRGASKVPSLRTTMIVDPEAGRGLLGRIFGAMTAAAVQQKRTFLHDKLGEAIASSALTMRDDPFRPRLGGSRLWDGEGIASQRRDVVRDGVMQLFFTDTYYGHKLGWQPNTAGPSNVVFEHGDLDAAGLMAAAGEAIYVDSWLGGNANLTSGDFSFGLRGHVVRGGQKAEPVSEMNVTGNYADLLGKLVAVGNDPVPWASFRTPTLVFEGIQFSGA